MSASASTRADRFRATMQAKKAAGWRKTQPKGFRRGPDSYQRTRRPVQPHQRIVINPRTHRAADTLGDIYLEKKPVNLESWWMVGQSPEQREAWHARASKEVGRMCGSAEFKKLGERKAVDEIRRQGSGLN